MSAPRRRPLRAIGGEIIASAAAARTPSLVTALVVAAVTITGMFTAGRSAAAERTLADRVDAAGARIITITDGTGTAGLTDTALTRAASLPELAWVIGLGLVTNVWPISVGAEGTPIAGRTVIGQAPPAILVVSGRWPDPGEAVVTAAGARGLGLTTGAGAITDGSTTYPVVGIIATTTPALDLSADVLMRADLTGKPLPQLVAMTDTLAHVVPLTTVLPEVTGAERPSALRVHSSDDLLQLQQVLGADFSRYSRAMAALVMLAGTVLIALTMHGAMTARRRDFGRRRALGASRSTLVAMVLGHSVLPAGAGAVLGAAAGQVLVTALTHSNVPPAYTVALAILGVLAATVAALPAGIATAVRDPVRELRVP